MNLSLGRQYNIIEKLKLIDLNYKLFIKVLLHITIFGLILIIFLYRIIVNIYSDRIYETISENEKTQFAIVFGTSLDQNGNPEEMLSDRVLKAVELYKNGSVQRILISGKDQYVNFSEVSSMKELLLQNNVPEFVIVEDRNAERTFDTCYNAKKVFKLNKAILITQKFHLSRALYLCNSMGIDSIGVSADASIYQSYRIIVLREYLAIFRAVLDINIIKPIPDGENE